MAITVAGEALPDKLRTKCRQSQIQPPFQDLAPGWKQPSPDNNVCQLNLYLFFSTTTIQIMMDSCQSVMISVLRSLWTVGMEMGSI